MYAVTPQHCRRWTFSQAQCPAHFWTRLCLIRLFLQRVLHRPLGKLQAGCRSPVSFSTYSPEPASVCVVLYYIWVSPQYVWGCHGNTTNIPCVYVPQTQWMTLRRWYTRCLVCGCLSDSSTMMSVCRWPLLPSFRNARFHLTRDSSNDTAGWPIGGFWCHIFRLTLLGWKARPAFAKKVPGTRYYSLMENPRN